MSTKRNDIEKRLSRDDWRGNMTAEPPKPKTPVTYDSWKIRQTLEKGFAEAKQAKKNSQKATTPTTTKLNKSDKGTATKPVNKDKGNVRKWR